MSSDDKRSSVPPTADEILEAEEGLRAIEDGDDPIGEILASSYRPHEIAEADHERILEQALAKMGPATDEERPASEPEKRDAIRLRDALEVDPLKRDPDAPTHPLADLARAAKNAHDPRPIAEIRHEAILRPALKTLTVRQNRRYVAATIVGALAVAAAVLGLWIKAPPDKGTPSAANVPAAGAEPMQFMPGMVEVHSTTNMFDVTDFPREGGTSERIDRISDSRNAEMRQNRFVQWGVP